MKKFTLLILCILLSSTFLFSQSLWKHRSGPNYLPNDTVLSIDSKGDTLMLGTIDGLIIKTPQQQTLLTTADGLASDKIDKIEVADDGTFMCYHIDDQALSYFDGANFQVFQQGIDFDGPLRNIACDGNNVFYYSGGQSLRIYAFTSSSFQNTGPSYPSLTENSLARGPEGAVYSFTDTAIFKYKNGSLIASLSFQGANQVLGSDLGILIHANNQQGDLYLYNSMSGFENLNSNNEFNYEGGKLLYFENDSSIWVKEKHSIAILGSDQAMRSLNLNFSVAPRQIVKWNNKLFVQSYYSGYWESYNDDFRLQKDKLSSQNKMKLRLNPNGSIGFVRDEFSSDAGQFEGKRILYNANSWITGKVQQSQQNRLAADQLDGWNEFAPVYSQRLSSGPYSSDYDVFKNHQAWRVTQSQIDDHIANYSEPGYEAPRDIRNWPAHGATNRGQAKCIAPFVDVDNDGIYKPENGDYPQIRGEETIYAVFNDKYNRVSGEQPMGIEGHVMMYTYTSSDPKLSNTVFLNYRVINRSVNNYEDFKFGYNIDADLGNPVDDYTGCDTNNNFFYFYNGDAIDQDNAGSEGFDLLTPSLGLVFLENDMSSFMSYKNSSGINGTPSSVSDFLNYLNAKYRNGQAPEDLQGQPSSFMYSGDPVTNTGWTEENAGNQPFDRRGVGAISIPQFNSGDTVEINMALTLAENDGTVDNFEVVGDLRSQVQDIQQWYNNQQFDPWEYDCNAYNSVPDRDLTENSSFKLYPNPAESYVRIEFADEQNNSNQVEIFNTLGAMVRSQKVSGKRANIKLDNIPAGIYLIRVSGSDINETKRLIVK